jgi:hypothetical protein
MNKFQIRKTIIGIFLIICTSMPTTVAYALVPFASEIQGGPSAQYDQPTSVPTPAPNASTNTPPQAAASSDSVQSSLEQVFSIQDKDFNLDTVVGDKNKNLLNNLPKAKDENTFNDLYGSVAKLMLAVATIGIFVALFVAGAIMAINQGDENATKTAKDIVKYVIIGVIIIAAAYGIVTGITRLKPF